MPVSRRCREGAPRTLERASSLTARLEKSEPLSSADYAKRHGKVLGFVGQLVPGFVRQLLMPGRDSNPPYGAVQVLTRGPIPRAPVTVRASGSARGPHRVPSAARRAFLRAPRAIFLKIPLTIFRNWRI